METRKIIKSGPSTLVLAIPKKWAERVGIHKGDSVIVEPLSNKLIISPIKTSTSQAPYEIDFSPSTAPYLEYLIYAAFHSDKTILMIRGLKKEDYQSIFQILKKIPYFKVEERGPDNLRLRFIVDPTIIDLEKELNKTFLFFEQFFALLWQKNLEEIQEVYSQLSLNISLLMKMLKIKFLEYDKNDILRFKQQVDTYYFLLKVCKEYLQLYKDRKPTLRDTHLLKRRVQDAIQNCKDLIEVIQKKDTLKVLSMQERICKKRFELIQEMRKEERNRAYYFLTNDLYKAIENIAYSYINNQE